MAQRKYIKEVQKEDGKFGKYKTGTGGGEPMGQGEKYPAGGKGVWSSKYGKKPHREEGQPRTDDGKFTYNAVNGKELKDVSKVHGKSRGVTVPPTLTGGENGVQYYEKNKQGHRKFDENGESVYSEDADRNIKKHTNLTPEQVFKKGDEIVTFKGKVADAPADFVEAASVITVNKDEASKEKYGKVIQKIANKEKITEEDVADLENSTHYEGDQISRWETRDAKTENEKRAVEKAEAEGTKGREFVGEKYEKPAEPEFEYTEDNFKAIAEILPDDYEVKDIAKLSKKDQDRLFDKAADEIEIDRKTTKQFVKRDSKLLSELAEATREEYGSETKGLSDTVVAMWAIDQIYNYKLNSIGRGK